jgi:hypothetical protein
MDPLTESLIPLSAEDIFPSGSKDLLGSDSLSPEVMKNLLSFRFSTIEEFEVSTLNATSPLDGFAMVLSVREGIFNFSPFSCINTILRVPKLVRSKSVGDPSGPVFIILNLYSFLIVY